MTRQTKQDPYCGFKDDRERRMALNVRARWYAAAAMAAALASAPTDWMGKFRWLMSLFH